jgi:subtilisin family serine protease
MRSRIRFILLSTIVLVVLVTQVLAQGPERVSVLVQLTHGAARDPVRAFAASQGGYVRYEYNILPGVINLRNIPVTALDGLRKVRGVVRVSEDPVIQLNLQDSTPLIRGLQSQIQSAGLSANGEGIRICVPDTGIDSNHWMFQDWPDTTRTRIDYRAALNLVGTGFPEDDQGHGAHVSGIAAGREGLVFNGLPFQGIAPKATIIPVKVPNSEGAGEGSDLIAAFEHCTDPNLTNGPADVISVSLGYGAFSDRATCDAEDVVSAANAAVRAGAVVVAASGNEGSPDAMAAPACGSGVISVGGTLDYSGLDLLYCGLYATVDDVLCFSNRSTMLDVVAPGCSIHSAATDLLYDAPNAATQMCGTSMAAPHVAGLAALLLQLNPGLHPVDVRDCIRNGAEDKGAAGFDPAYGYGRISVTNSLGLCRPDSPVNQPPTARITYTCTHLSCTFTSTSSDPDGTIVSYVWNFGDGGTATTPGASHTYASGGTYNVTLTVEDDDQATGTTNLNVTVSENQPPKPSFTNSCTGLTCDFDGSGSSDPDGTIVGYIWSFDDGGTATTPLAKHMYTSGGTYTVTLTVTDNDQATQYRSEPVSVTGPSTTIILSATGYKLRERQKADLSWSGARTVKVDVYRNSTRIATTMNDGSYTDSLNKTGGLSYEYQICEAKTSVCSNKVTVLFQ